MLLGRWRRPRGRERIDPFGVGEPWRRYVQGALQARARYQQAVSGVAPGPLRERLDYIGGRIDHAAQECWHVAQRGNALEDAVSALDEGGARMRLTAMATEAREQLARLETCLGQAAASAAELSALSVTDSDTAGLGDAVDHLVDEIAALRAALEEVSGPAA